MNNKFRYGSDKLTIELALKLARGQIKGEITEEVKTKILKCFINRKRNNLVNLSILQRQLFLK